MALALQEMTHEEPGFRVESPPGTAPAYTQYIKPKETQLVLLLLVLGDGPPGPQLNWCVCSVLLQDLEHLHSRWDTQKYAGELTSKGKHSGSSELFHIWLCS